MDQETLNQRRYIRGSELVLRGACLRVEESLKQYFGVPPSDQVQVTLHTAKVGGLIHPLPQ